MLLSTEQGMYLVDRRFDFYAINSQPRFFLPDARNTDRPQHQVYLRFCSFCFIPSHLFPQITHTPLSFKRLCLTARWLTTSTIINIALWCSMSSQFQAKGKPKIRFSYPMSGSYRSYQQNGERVTKAAGGHQRWGCASFQEKVSVISFVWLFFFGGLVFCVTDTTRT